MHNVKLVEPPRRRVRVHELAAHVGTTPMTLLLELRSSGEWVASISTKVEEPTVRKVCVRFGVATPWESHLDETTAKPPAQNPRSAAEPTFKPSHAARTARANNPLMDLGLTAEDLEHKNAAVRTPAYGAVSRVPTSPPPGEAAPAWADGQWVVLGFTEEERDRWISAGLRPSQAKSARELADAGIVPDQLTETVGGYTMLVRIRNGEGGRGVARMYIAQRNTRAESA